MKNSTTRKILLAIGVVCFISSLAQSQSSQPNRPRCGKHKQQVKIDTPKSTEKKIVKIELPQDYEPPVTPMKEYQFPETFAQKKKLKLIRKRNKKQKGGCVASRM
ncbi:MAG: hypothetical protein GY810_06445 [Aureispira sp.]|nr:hypothetical protein [Aureispira sp.]